MLYRIMLWGSRLAVVLLAISFVVPYLAPERFPNLSMASLVVSPLILLNIIFLIYWFLKRWRKGVLTALVLFVAYIHFGPFMEFSSEGDPGKYRENLSVLTYNVRLFNAYEKSVDTVQVSEMIASMIDSYDPDVIAIQEYYEPNSVDFSMYPFSYIHYKSDQKLGHAIFSKYPIVSRGAFDFKKSYNNSIYADIVKGSDTLRVYNLHLQSIGILPKMGYLQDGDKERIRLRMAGNFKKQQAQVEEIIKHKNTSPYPVLMAGDFNNTAFSYVYRKLTRDMTDSFLVRGNGIGSTFKFDFFPMRIDYILASENAFGVIDFETVKNSFSDHKAVFSVLGWPPKSE